MMAMFNVFKKLLPKEEKFFDLFEAHAAKAVAAAASLRAIFEGGKNVSANCKTLMAHEADADKITEDVMQALRRSFITPFDRSDIQTLITAMDDAVDQMNKTAKAILLYEVGTFEPTMKAMADDVVKLAALGAEALPLLRNVGQNANRLHTLTAQMIAIEDASDYLHEDGLKALLKGKAKKDPMTFIIGSQIYEHLEKVADRFEEVAHVISGIVIEHV
jgi:uncharacterized protein Yka (UPF0111/DUF47 family)